MTSRPGLLTPVTTSPLPFGINEISIASMPVISLPKSPNTKSQTPSSEHAPRIQHTSLVPMVSISATPQLNSPRTVPSVEEIDNLAQQISALFSSKESINLPTVSVTNLPFSVQLPSVVLPNVSGIPLVTLPNMNNVGSLPSVSKNLELLIPTLLADNKLGDLRWNRPDSPQPILITSTYKRVGCIGDGSCFFHVIAKGLSEIYQLSYKMFEDISEETLHRFEVSVNNTVIFPSELFTTQRENNLNIHYTFAQPYGQIAFENLMTSFRGAYVRMLRQDFANQMLTDARMQGLIRQRLSGSIDLRIDTLIAQARKIGQILTRGQVQEQAFQDVTRKLAQELLSGNAVQPDFMLLLSDYINIDIYLLRDTDLIDTDPTRTPLYSGSSLHEAIHGPADMRPTNSIYSGLSNRCAIVIISIDDFHYEIVARVDQDSHESIPLHSIHPNMTQDEPLIRRLYEMLINLRSTK